MHSVSTSQLRCVVLGGGGHARVLIDCLQLGSDVLPIAILDSDSSMLGRNIFGVPIRGGDDSLQGLIDEGVNSFLVGLGSSGNNGPRQRLYELGSSFRLTPVSVIHPSAIYSSLAKFGPGFQLLPGAIINTGTVIQANVIVNTGAIVEHDCMIGDHVHIASGARLSGNVRVGALAHIGSGATLREGLVIGEGAIIGAGSVVVKDVPARTLVVGVPAKPVRQVD